MIFKKNKVDETTTVRMVNNMSTEDIPFVAIPEELYPILGEPEEGTHIYRKDGPQEEIEGWFDAIHKYVGRTMSPGGASAVAGVSRAAVHKRIKEGKLSLFLYHITYRKTQLFGKTKTVRQSPYGLIPVSECKAWRRELEQRALQQGRITKEELEGLKPDWDGTKITHWPNASERESLFEDLRRHSDNPFTFFPEILIDEMKKLVGIKKMSGHELIQKLEREKQKHEQDTE